MPSSLFEKICLDAGIKKELFCISYLPDNWGRADAGRKGMKTLLKKYKAQLPLWRAKAGHNIAGRNIKTISYPVLNEELAEFIGIYLGDGTITKDIIRISGDSRYDLYYFEYISYLVRVLFNLDSRIATEKRSKGLSITIYSKNLCSFLKDKYGINFGDKIRNQTKIPQEILKNKKLALACLRGLVDTDGCISRRGRNGSQFCVQFFNGNKTLLQQVKEIGFKYGFFSYFTGGEVGTNNWINIKKYFGEVGSSNMKHIVRFNVRLKEGKTIYLREVLDYYKEPLYKNIQLPFKMAS